jgi:DNA integrity scanning protein DisA with diadenylate cyclase activity
MVNPLQKMDSKRLPNFALQCKLKGYTNRKTIKDNDDVRRGLRLFHGSQKKNKKL